MINDKSKKKETLKNEPKKMPEANRSGRIDSNKSKENQAPNKFGHRLNKEETYESKRTDVPKAETYER